MSDLKQLIADRDALNERIRKIGKEEFGALVSGIFEKEDITNFGWWNAPYSCYNDGASPGIGCLTADIDTTDRYLDLGSYGGVVEPRICKYLRDAGFTDEILCEIFDHDHDDNEVVVVFPNRVEFFERPDY